MTDLYPTPTRLGLLRQVANNQCAVDILAEDWRIVLWPDAPTSWADQRTVTARIEEMQAVGWVAVNDATGTVAITDAGWSVLDGVARGTATEAT